MGFVVIVVGGESFSASFDHDLLRQRGELDILQDLRGRLISDLQTG